MKWIGQHIYDLIARFRSDVYLEDVSTGTIASGGNLGLDSNNKIVKATEASGDITGVTITTDSGGGSAASDTGGSADFSILGTSGVGVTNSTTTITVTSVPGEIDHDSLLNFASNEHFTQASIDTVATIETGVWNGDPIPSAYLDSDTAHLTTNQTFSGKKTFSSTITQDGNQSLIPGDGAAIHVDGSDITDTNTSASGTAAMFTHVNIEAPRLFATNASVTTTDAATLYIKAAPVAGTNQTITNAYALWVDAGNARFDGDIDLEGDIDVNGTLETDALTVGGTNVLTGSLITTLGTISAGVWNGTAIASAYMASATDSAKGAVELATTAEAVTGTDTARAVTPAGLAARVSQIVNLKGYVTLQNNVYDYGNSFVTDDEAPFQLDDSYASGTIDSSTEVGQATLFRSAGFHVPFACTVSALQVQASCSGSGGGNVTVALVEYRPSTAGGDTSDYPRTVYEEVNVASNNNNNKIGTTTVDAGDLDATAIPAGSHLMIMVKGDSTTAGDTAVVSMSIGLSW